MIPNTTISISSVGRGRRERRGVGGTDTLAGGGGFLPKGSEDPNGSFLSVFLKKSSDEVPLKGSFSLNGSPPNGSRKKERNASKDSGSKDILLAFPPQYEKTVYSDLSKRQDEDQD